jgi:polar amino acid transport system substrate-binding protein
MKLTARPMPFGAVLAGTAVLASTALLASCSVPGAPPATGHAAAASATAKAASPARSTTAPTPACDPEASSLAPLGPAVVTPGSTMAKIRERGYLIAGVDQTTYGFGYLDPLTGRIVGFDIDMIRAVAKAIFGNPNKVEWKAITDSQRKPDLLNGSVDIVAHTMTIKCDRLEYADFSAVYFMAHQKILVPKDSTVRSAKDLAGQKVCVTSDSDSAAQLIASLPASARPVIVGQPYITDCLVLLQQNQVAAITTDDSILSGLVKQDPFTMVLKAALSNEPYGMAIPKKHQDFVQFVNAVLAKEIASGAWRDSYKLWISSTSVPSPPPQLYAN